MEGDVDQVWGCLNERETSGQGGLQERRTREQAGGPCNNPDEEGRSEHPSRKNSSTPTMLHPAFFTRSLFSKPRAVLPSRPQREITVFVRETAAAATASRPHQQRLSNTHPSRSVSSASGNPPPASSAVQAPVSEASISAKLARKFPQAVKLRVEDVSGGCGSFFVVEVVDQSFEGLSMLKQHQLINRTLADDIDRIHGLQIHTRVPSQQPS